jgi:hypothetical protein
MQAMVKHERGAYTSSLSKIKPGIDLCAGQLNKQEKIQLQSREGRS